MPHAHPVRPTPTLHRAVVDGEDHRVALFQRHHGDPRLLPRALLGQHELAAGEATAGRRQQDRRLQGKDQRSVLILMQPIEVAESVLFMVTRSKNVTVRDIVILPNSVDL